VAIDFADVIDAANIRMRNTSRDANFIAKALEKTFVAGGSSGKTSRHWLAKRQVIGAVDLAMPPFPSRARSDTGLRASVENRPSFNEIQNSMAWTRRRAGRRTRRAAVATHAPCRLTLPGSAGKAKTPR
jgi:hypothetical protein